MCFERVGPKMCDENIFSQSQTIFEVFWGLCPQKTRKRSKAINRANGQGQPLKPTNPPISTLGCNGTNEKKGEKSYDHERRWVSKRITFRNAVVWCISFHQWVGGTNVVTSIRSPTIHPIQGSTLFSEKFYQPCIYLLLVFINYFYNFQRRGWLLG